MSNNNKIDNKLRFYPEDTRIIFRVWNYIRRGHSNYTAYFILLLNFIIIAYQLAISNMPILKAVFPSMLIFGIIFLIVYFPVVLFIGWLDMKRGTYPQDQIVNWDLNPRQRQQYEWIYEIKRDIEDVKKVVKKMECVKNEN